MPAKRPIKLSGYTRVEKPFSQLNLSGDYIALREHLERSSEFGVIIPPAGNANIGTVLKIAPLVREMTGISEGDEVLFTEWQGGKWAFLDPESRDGELRCLIMSSDWVLARLEP